MDFFFPWQAPKPFAVAYQADGDGGASFMSEEGDASGNVRGSYGYRDDQGLYRLVENSAGQGGFQAAVKTNEPGVEGKENPTDVIMNVQQAPEAIQDKYTRILFIVHAMWVVYAIRMNPICIFGQVCLAKPVTTRRKGKPKFHWVDDDDEKYLT
ncbi:uncharacterized protein CEXT_232091 [Caerostris extrusa]|uniref:Uncharacterized protein n=1 Tax=Caerostris extrusa TaxID=172846 RepID=A0AAV4Y6E0_CAEEX|nr:uncharacterized protein CEXT_232091 [Caerostris extrusa]